MSDSTSAIALSQPLYGATFGEALRRFFAKYATVSGRASRSEYWWVVLALGLINLVFSILFTVSGGTPGADGSVSLNPALIIIISLWGLFNLAVIIPTIALTVRRLHDGNFSGWLYLLTLVGLSIVVFILTLLPSKPEGARFDA